jgi:hypothetical protein
VDRLAPTAGRGRRRGGLALIALAALSAQPACRSTAPFGLEDGARREPYSAFRPRYDRPPRRTLFLGGYAGYNYGPVFNRNRVPTDDGGEVWGVPISRHAAPALR